MADSEAWVTLATNDSYCLGALVLAESLKRVGTTRKLVILITPGVSASMRTTLESVFNLVKIVNILDSGDATNLAILTRPELGITFTKFECWKLTQFSKCVFLDADVLVIQNCDDLFEREEFSAAPDAGWPDCFNSGVFVYRPSQETFDKLMAFAIEQGSFDGGDQGLLNSFFPNWNRIPFIYNMVASAVYSYLPAYKAFGKNVKIAHFIGPNKPWLQFLDTATGQVHPPSGQEHLRELLQAWWDIFRSEIHRRLHPEMEGNKEPNATIMEQVENLSIQIMETSPESFNQYPPPSQPQDYVDLDNLNVAIRRYPPIYTHNPTPPQSYGTFTKSESSSDFESRHETSSDSETYSESIPKQSHNYSQQTQIDQSHTPKAYFSQDSAPTHFTPLISHSHPTASPIPTQSPTTEKSKVRRNPSGKSKKQARPSKTGKAKGLAGVFAGMSLEGAKSSEQLEHENIMRKHAWEQGNIDYMGKDSFDNILKKIQETMAQSSMQPKAKSPSPPKTIPKAAEIPAPVPVQEEVLTETKAPITSESKPPEAAISSQEVKAVEPQAAPPQSPATITTTSATEPPSQAAAPIPEQIQKVETVTATPQTEQIPVQPPTPGIVPSTAAPPLTQPSTDGMVPADEPLVTMTHAPAECVCHPPPPSTESIAPPPITDPAKSLEDLEDELLAAERAALEKKLAEQKRTAEQKLMEERAAAKKLEELAKQASETPPVVQAEVKESKVETTAAPPQQPVTPTEVAKQPEKSVEAPSAPASEPPKPTEAPPAPAKPEPPKPTEAPAVPAKPEPLRPTEAPPAPAEPEPPKPTEAPPTPAKPKPPKPAEAPPVPGKPEPPKASGPPAAAAAPPPQGKAEPGKKPESAPGGAAAGGKPAEPKAPPRKPAKVWSFLPSLGATTTGIIVAGGISLGTFLFLRR